jgi:hypothetical protein
MLSQPQRKRRRARKRLRTPRRGTRFSLDSFYSLDSLYSYKRTNTDACGARHQAVTAAAGRRAEEEVGELQRQLADAETAASQLQERIGVLTSRKVQIRPECLLVEKYKCGR